MSDPGRLHKLLLMLSSPYGGEVTTAAKAIGSLLEKDGRDWHWLAQCVAECPHRKPEEPKSRPSPIADWDDWEACDIAEQLLKIGAGRLSAWAKDFLDSMALWNGEATARQYAILRSIAAKLGWSP